MPSKTSLPINPDIIVIGAGVAGLSCAQSLMDEGLDVLVLEADAHSGGRCISNNSLFSSPFDLGGSWLHSAEINPLARLAETGNIKLHKTPWVWQRVHAEGRLLNDQEILDYRYYHSCLWESIRKAGLTSSAISVAEALPLLPWKETAKLWVPQMLSADAENISAADFSAYQATEGDWLVAGGLGNFLQALHHDVPVVLNCPVTKIDYSGKDIHISTVQGNIRAKRVIVTVSTAVLNSGNITFLPALPEDKRTAISALPCGTLNKVGIEFSSQWHEVTEGYVADYHRGNDEFCTLHFGFAGTCIAVGFVAGGFGKSLEKAGQQAATNFCLEALCALFGNDVLKYVRNTTETAWGENQYVQGAYSYAVVGNRGARSILEQPIDNRLYFAGEATISEACATVHGAYLSGKRAAEYITRPDKAYISSRPNLLFHS